MIKDNNSNPAQAWDERYKKPEFAYGTAPNVFLAQELEKLKPGSILFPAEGEGRNAVYAAKQGWNVFAFDISIEGKNKAQQLANKNGAKVDYAIGPLEDLGYQVDQFDAIALIYAHFPPHIRKNYLSQLESYLKPGGTMLIEAFGSNHLAYRARNEKVGGPPVAELLYTLDEVLDVFSGYLHTCAEEVEVELNEGLYHNGTGSVVRFVARKPYP